jgi:putative GTP pyrophosphokinase
MASVDFDNEKAEFQNYYDTSLETLDGAKESYLTLVRSLLAGTVLEVSKIEGRIKSREECLKKFTRKYRSALEASSTPYTIKDYITDLIGLRIVCLYEDEVEPISAAVRQHFTVLSVTDKIAEIEGTENSFGYKGLHLDLKLSELRAGLPEYQFYRDIPFELQIRTVVQDSWSILDHKIKYKKVIPSGLKRRINTLAALFELADREFREVRNATLAEIEKAETEDDGGDISTDTTAPATGGAEDDIEPRQWAPLNAFRFLRIAKHFFPQFEFEPHKVDGFTAEIVQCKPDITRGKFNFYLRENVAAVKEYQAILLAANPTDSFNAYTVIRHCLYAGDPVEFESMLTNAARESFQKWRLRQANAEVQAAS